MKAIKKRTPEEIDRIFIKLLSKFVAPLKGVKPKENEKDNRRRYHIEDYYGVGLMPYKKDDKVGISLFYDYSGKHSIKSSIFKVNESDAIEIYSILHSKRKIQATVIDSEFSLDKAAEEPVKVDDDSEDIEF